MMCELHNFAVLMVDGSRRGKRRKVERVVIWVVQLGYGQLLNGASSLDVLSCLAVARPQHGGPSDGDMR